MLSVPFQVPFSGPDNEDYSFLVSILGGLPGLGKVPYGRVLKSVRTSVAGKGSSGAALCPKQHTKMSAFLERYQYEE